MPPLLQDRHVKKQTRQKRINASYALMFLVSLFRWCDPAGAVGRWKAATKASTPREWLLQLEQLLTHTVPTKTNTNATD